MCPGAVLREAAVNMLMTILLSVLLMLGGLGGAAVSDPQFYGKSIHSDKTLLSSDDGRHTVRKQPNQQTKNEIHRSLDLKSFNVHVSPTTSKVNLPTIIKLYPPTAKPPHLHPNMPMRFGRESDPVDDRLPNSTPNMPQRFGRSWEVIRMCADCPDAREALSPVLPQRFGRNSPYWSLRRTLANAQLLKTGLHWAEDFDFTTSSEEVKMQEENL
ncbi:pro-FMRFamide-related neuropeptide VF [Thunnus maccoyii]|nr:pro-FMRFamide-related neuropeptide VF [Thunnus maccoyii]